ncbi:glutathione peroxidase [Salpingoeca rosetta]|uniref:Glutathione peroxidase n=1 Tax=Salpingoeca rosetta (strain ATCC 50818 / BSB-021) TaxID=946362 RepID=F2UG00_SALR5|nr:glutathione peroxidase [Salpingoeca rosetta]EGD75428.1 glutathione peroxidase [Salpingoeca rosetta]|eukprot:XP_004991885.1 glutathione peroxidase [Salpingoeca rosetta]
MSLLRAWGRLPLLLLPRFYSVVPPLNTAADMADDKPIRAVLWRQEWEALSPDVQAARKMLARELAESNLIDDRTYHLQTYRQCFVASDAVSYMVENGKAESREAAVGQLQHLVEGNLIHHVTFDHTFSDAKLFFRATDPASTGPGIFTLAGDKKNVVCWATVSGVGFLGLGSNPTGVIGLDREGATIHHFTNDIAPAPKSSLPVDDSVEVKYLDESKGHAIVVSNTKGTKLNLTFRDSTSKEKFVEGVVACGGRVLEDASELVKNATSLFEFEAVNNAGEKVSFETFRPKEYRDVNGGFEVIAFPSNQFRQELKDNAGILEHARGFGAEFPIMEKVWVNGSKTHPVFQFLKSRLGGSFGSFVKWNYTKFVCDSEGKPVRRFGPSDAPDTMEPLIRGLMLAWDLTVVLATSPTLRLILVVSSGAVAVLLRVVVSLS